MRRAVLALTLVACGRGARNQEAGVLLGESLEHLGDATEARLEDAAHIPEATKELWKWGAVDAACAGSTGRAPGDKSPRLSAEQLHRSVVTEAGAFRLRRLLAKLRGAAGKKAAGAKQISVAVVGGSVEQGYSLPSNSTVWEEWVARWLQAYFPGISKPSVQFINLQAIHDMRSPLDWGGGTWADMLVHKPFDLVLIQNSLNFPMRSKRLHAQGEKYPYVRDVPLMRTYEEKAIRRLLETDPAVVFVAWLHDKSDRDFYYGTWQDDSTSFLATYYEISMVSARDALLHSVFEPSGSDHKLGPHFHRSSLFTDGIHPTALGHQVFAQVVSYSLCRQFQLLEGPLKSGTSAHSRRRRKLPKALFPDPGQQQEFRRSFARSGFGIESPNASLAPVKVELNQNFEVDLNDTANVSASVRPAMRFELLATAAPFALLELLTRRKQTSEGAPSLDLTNMPRSFNLELLRFAGVAHIVFFHEWLAGSMATSSPVLQNVASFGKYWVPFFFALSGYVLFVSQRGSLFAPDGASFFWRRIKLAYPGYFCGAVVGLVAAANPGIATLTYIAGVDQYLPGFFMVESWMFPFGKKSPNPACWFLSTLCFFWLCFPHWYEFVRRLRMPCRVTILVWLTTFAIPLLRLAQIQWPALFGKLSSSDFVAFHPLAHWQAFLFGMCLGRLALEPLLVSRFPRLLRKAGASAILFIIVGLCATSPGLPYGDPGVVASSLLDRGPLLLPVVAFLLLLIPFGEDVLLRPVVMESSVARWLGAMSAHLFILHWPVRLLLMRYSLLREGFIMRLCSNELLATFAVQFTSAAIFHEVLSCLQGRPPARKAAENQNVPTLKGKHVDWMASFIENRPQS